jgi:hypothetical protein
VNKVLCLAADQFVVHRATAKGPGTTIMAGYPWFADWGRDAFVALPGGMGTLEETTEVLTWAQLGIHHKPVGLLDVAGYWRPLVAFLDHAVESGFVRPEHRALLLVERDPEPLLDRLAAWRAPPTRPWMGKDQT